MVPSQYLHVFFVLCQYAGGIVATAILASALLLPGTSAIEGLAVERVTCGIGGARFAGCSSCGSPAGSIVRFIDTNDEAMSVDAFEAMSAQS